MSRRNAAEKRPILPDPQFNSRLASMMVARLMKHGKKSTAQRILSDAFGLIGERTGADPLEVFETAVRNSTPWWKCVHAEWVVPPIRCPWKCVRNAAPPWPCAGW